MGILNFLKVKEQISTMDEAREILFDKEFLIVGEAYPCRKNKKYKRLDIIKKTKLHSPVHIEKYTYNREPAYMVVNTKRDLDLGVLSAGAAAWLSDYYNKGTVKVELTNRYKSSFHVRVTVYK